MVIDFGQFEGTNVNEKMYRFEFTEDTRLKVNGRTVVKVNAGTSLEIVDKVRKL